MKLASTLLKILSDGHFHSGPELGQLTGCTRSAVWKTIHMLQSKDIEIYSVHGKGYRLHEPVELLDQEKINSGLNEEARSCIKQLDVLFEVDSTNTYLLEVARKENRSGIVCLSEQQRSGRGRRGRSWISPFGGNLYLSFLWRFPFGASQVTGLSLAIAVAVVRALREIGYQSVGVKWPNDIVVSNRKLAGILLEMTGEASGPCSIVMGIGMNVKPNASMAIIDQPWTDLESELGRPVERNDLAARLINCLCEVVEQFERDGLSPFLEEWKNLDVYQGENVELQLPGTRVQGVVRGIDDTGALLLEHDGEVRPYQSGEVSMRAISE